MNPYELYALWESESPKDEAKLNAELHRRFTEMCGKTGDVLSRIRVGDPVSLSGLEYLTPEPMPPTYKEHGTRLQRVNSSLFSDFLSIRMCEFMKTYGLEDFDGFVNRELLKMREHLARAVVRGKGLRHGITGLTAWPDITQLQLTNTCICRDMIGFELTVESLDDVIMAIFIDEKVDFKRGDWWVVCPPGIHEHVGREWKCYKPINNNPTRPVMWFHSRIGKPFPFLPEKHMPKGTVVIADLSDFEYRFVQPVERRTIPMPEDEDTEDGDEPVIFLDPTWSISTEVLGLVCEDPRAIGKLYNVYREE